MRISRTGNNSEGKCEVGCDRIVRSVREQVDGGTVVHKQGWDSRIFPAKNDNEHENQLGTAKIKRKRNLLNELHHSRQFS